MGSGSGWGGLEDLVSLVCRVDEELRARRGVGLVNDGSTLPDPP